VLFVLSCQHMSRNHVVSGHRSPNFQQRAVSFYRQFHPPKGPVSPGHIVSHELPRAALTETFLREPRAWEYRRIVPTLSKRRTKWLKNPDKSDDDIQLRNAETPLQQPPQCQIQGQLIDQLYNQEYKNSVTTQQKKKRSNTTQRFPPRRKIFISNADRLQQGSR
jgi:hypothetical protein